MVAVAQLVERWLVEPNVTGSIPVGHPKIRPRCICIWVFDRIVSLGIFSIFAIILWY